MGSDWSQIEFRFGSARGSGCSDLYQILLGSGLRRFRLGSDLGQLGAKAVQIGFGLGSYWVQIGVILVSDLALFGSKAVQIGFRFGSARG